MLTKATLKKKPSQSPFQSIRSKRFVGKILETPNSPCTGGKNMFAPGIHAQLHCNSVLEMLLVKNLVIWTSMCCTFICILFLYQNAQCTVPPKDLECKPQDLDNEPQGVAHSEPVQRKRVSATL